MDVPKTSKRLIIWNGESSTKQVRCTKQCHHSPNLPKLSKQETTSAGKNGRLKIKPFEGANIVVFWQ